VLLAPDGETIATRPSASETLRSDPLVETNPTASPADEKEQLKAPSVPRSGRSQARRPRNGAFDERGIEVARDVTTLTFWGGRGDLQPSARLGQGAGERGSIDDCLKPLIDRFRDRALQEVKTADIEDFNRGETTKSRTTRVAPISTTRLKAVRDSRTCRPRYSSSNAG